MAKLFDGTGAITASVAGTDIVAEFLATKGFAKGECRMNFYPKEDITISQNGSVPILLEVGDTINETGIESLILLEDGKNYRFYAAYDTKDLDIEA